MKTIEKIVYMTEKGQITLPVAWRRKVGTKAVRIRSNGNDLLEIVPIEDNDNWVSVFNSQRDNNGKGLTSGEFLEVIRRPRKNSGKKI